MLFLQQYELRENTSKIYFNGSVWESVNCGKFKIIGHTNKFRIDKRGYKLFESFLCEFNDGTIVESQFSNIRLGNIKNPNSISVFGVGYLGIGKWKSKNDKKVTKEYRLWVGMLRRCYSEKFHKKYPTYKDCTVIERWHNFQNFCEDIQELEGYNDWRNIIALELDKMILCNAMGIFPKIYSKDTCIFITKKENLETGLTYISHRISDSYEEEFSSQIDFAEKWNLSNHCIVECLSGRQKIHKGWTFKVKE